LNKFYGLDIIKKFDVRNMFISNKFDTCLSKKFDIYWKLSTGMFETLFDTLINRSCVSHSGCRTFQSTLFQCWGSRTFWCWSGSRSPDPYLWLMDPDPNPDQAPFFRDFNPLVTIIIFLSDPSEIFRKCS
jgi:hypothetical protein